MLGVTTDNATNMDSMFNCLDVYCADEGITFSSENQRVRCLAHIINLAAQIILKALHGMGPENEQDILQDFINETSLGVIAKLRKLVVKIRASPLRRERFCQQCKAVNVKELQLIPDIKTRWNSTYDMIERAIFLREVKRIYINYIDFYYCLNILFFLLATS